MASYQVSGAGSTDFDDLYVETTLGSVLLAENV